MDGKKKKGKKKKGNHSNVSGSVFTADVNQIKLDSSLSNAEVLPVDHRDDSEAPCNADSPIVGLSESEVNQEKRKNLETKCFDLQDEINILRVEKSIWSQKEDSLEERIKLLQNEINSCIQKEAILQEKIEDLQSKNALLTSSIKEVVSGLGYANEGLQMQVKELKDSRDSLAQENKQLTDNMSTLESRIQRLEVVVSLYASSEMHGEEKPSSNATEASIKPDTLNDKGSEKASYLVGTADNLPSDNTMKHSSADYASGFPKSTLESNETIETKTKPNENLNVNGVESAAQLQQLLGLGLDDSRISEEVVSVPLADIIEELKPIAEKLETVVPLSDAPLIGAPFRLISFVARFVSGSDLVDKEKPK